MTESSGAVPVFDSESEGALKALGNGAYEVNYTNRSGKDLACIGVVLPEDVASEFYAEMQKPGFTFTPEYDEDGEPGSGDDTIDPELDEAYGKALEDGHFGIAVGDDGISYLDYVRFMVAAENPELTDEELDERLEEFESSFDGIFPGVADAFASQKLINFVDDDASATWVATMDEPLAEGEKAGGIVGCFDGVTRDLDIEETTYLEIEHAIAGPGPTGSGALSSSGLFGS